jgi:hypothetical protein
MANGSSFIHINLPDLRFIRRRKQKILQESVQGKQPAEFVDGTCGCEQGKIIQLQ